VGYLRDRLPHAFINSEGQLVGLDIEMAHELARELGVKLEFYPLVRDKVAEQLNGGYCDIIMSGTIDEMTLVRARMFRAWRAQKLGCPTTHMLWRQSKITFRKRRL
jgi:ABC-type amino acid transport substrate-binding protein